MRLSTFWLIITIVSVIILIVVLLSTYGITREISKTLIGGAVTIVLLLPIIVILQFYNTDIPTRYEEGTRIDGIKSAHHIKEIEAYEVTTFNGTMYEADEAVRANETYLLLRTRIYKTKLIGIEVYTVKDIVFINIEEENNCE